MLLGNLSPQDFFAWFLPEKAAPKRRKSMKKHTKLTAILLSVVMTLALLLSASGLDIFIIASSDAYKDYTTSAKYLETISVLKGYDDGELHLEEPILRYQAALFFARIITGITDESAYGSGKSAVFTDVPEYGPVMDLISSMGIIRGYGDGRFGYNAKIMYQDMCAMLVRALGYETDEMIKGYPMTYVLKVKELGLALENVKGTDYLNRGQTAQMVYDALTTEITVLPDDEYDALVSFIESIRGESSLNGTKDTYLERNFDVSSRMEFVLVATEKYKLDEAGLGYAEEDEIIMRYLYEDSDGNPRSEDWVFPIEGGPTGGVAEADLIGKHFTLVFDDKTPTQSELDNEEMKVIFAEMAEPDVYENLGELNTVKYDEDAATLTFGKKTVRFADRRTAAPTILTYTTNAGKVFAELDFEDLVGETGLLETDTYFRFEAYDYDDDGVYDELIYIPYTFGQYAVRNYKDGSNGNKATDYTMIGSYVTTPVYDSTAGTARTADTRTNFVERFAGTDKIASGSTANYTPGKTTITVSKANGGLAKEVELSGVAINSGDFMIYNYNKLTNELYVAANLGKLQTGTLSGLKKQAQSVVIDGSTMSVGILGYMDAATGILAGTDAYSSIEEPVLQPVLASYTKGEINVRYLEYDGKIAYIEAFSDVDNLVCADYVIVDIDKTLADHEKSLGKNDELWDIGFDGNNAVVKVYDPDTRAFATVKVESLTVREGSDDKTYDFKNAEERYKLGSWAKNRSYDLFKANGVLFLSRDNDNDGYLELYAIGTDMFEGVAVDDNGNRIGGIIGASVIQASGTNPDVTFSFGKTNKFVAKNYVGISTERFATGDGTVVIVIAGDGYAAVTGTIAKKTTEVNSLWLSANAETLRSDNKALVIFDPASELADIYDNDTASIWHSGSTSSNDEIGYYLFGAAANYVETRAMEDADGNLVEDEDGKRLYEHEYKNLINLRTNVNENVTIVSTDPTPVATEVINSVVSVIRVDAENNDVSLTSFGELYVENGDYAYGGFSWLSSKHQIAFATMPKNGKPGVKVAIDSSSDKVYDELSSVKVTFIDLDAGADVDYREYSFTDSYVFHQDSASNRASYQVIELEDIECPAGTMAVHRNFTSGADHSDVITNGTITTLNAGKAGLIATQHWFRWNGWSDYLIPAVDSKNETIWTYAGSLRVKVTYYAYIDYDEDTKALDAVIVRVGEIVGTVASEDDIPLVRDPETEGVTNENLVIIPE